MNGEASIFDARANAPQPESACKSLDFVVIGAAKAGTTTLFHHLRNHPGVYVPPGKERAFFTRDDAFERGWPAFVREFYPGAELHQKWGAVVTSYMADPRAATRMAATMPDVKIVAMLRNPIERAFSEYQMMVRKGAESRSFDVAVSEQVRPERAQKARTANFSPTDPDTFLVRGEYGRILAEYFSLFPAERIKAVFLEDFERDPATVYADIARFIGADPTWRSQDLGKKFHVGGSRKRFPNLLRRLSKIGILRSAWRRIPKSHQRDLLFFYATEINVDKSQRLVLPADQRARMREYFAEDVAALRRLVGRVPWEEFGATVG